MPKPSLKFPDSLGQSMGRFRGLPTSRLQRDVQTQVRWAVAVSGSPHAVSRWQVQSLMKAHTQTLVKTSVPLTLQEVFQDPRTRAPEEVWRPSDTGGEIEALI